MIANTERAPAEKNENKIFHSPFLTSILSINKKRTIKSPKTETCLIVAKAMLEMFDCSRITELFMPKTPTTTAKIKIVTTAGKLICAVLPIVLTPQIAK